MKRKTATKRRQTQMGLISREETMKRIFGLAVSALVSVFSLGTVNAGELLDQQRFIAAMEDSHEGYTYRNTINLDKYVAALEDGQKGYYRNTHNQESFVAALEDSRPGYYRNIHTQESFVASLGDDYTPGRYAAIMDSSRFAGLLHEKHAEEAVTASYAPKCGHRDIDYLAQNITLAMITEECK